MNELDIKIRLFNPQARGMVLDFFDAKEIDGPFLADNVIGKLKTQLLDFKTLCEKKEYQIQNFDSCLIIFSAILFRRSIPKYETFLSELDPLNKYMGKLTSPLNDQLNIKKIQIDFNNSGEPIVITDKRIMFLIYKHLYPGIAIAYKDFVKPTFREKETYAKQGKDPISVKKLKILAARALCYFEKHEPKLGKNVIPFIMDLFLLANVNVLSAYSNSKNCRDSLNKIAAQHAIRKP